MPEPAPSASVGPGLARFVAVDLKLAGGSLPSTAGLDWLVEKGYRTLLDLRESSEVSPAFIAEVTKRGLRYIALPIGPGSIDRDHVARFQFEIAAGEARPLYFFDSDGTRSGALWYIRRIATDRVDQQVARREAEELGLFDQAYWSAVTKYVSTLRRLDSPRPPSHRQRQRDSPCASRRAAGPAYRSTRTSLPTTTAQPPPKRTAHAARRRGLAGQPVCLAFVRRDGGHLRGPAAGLLEPHLAPADRAKTRASLPAPAQRSKSLPGESDA